MDTQIQQMMDDLLAQVHAFMPVPKVFSVGEVTHLGQGYIKVQGLSEARLDEEVKLPDGTTGLVLRLSQNHDGVVADVVLQGTGKKVFVGDTVTCTHKASSVPVGYEFLGRVINAVGLPIDGGPVIYTSAYRSLEADAPSVIARQDVDTSLATGILAIDSMIPIGRGQRELIIGDRNTGKTSIAMDTIINQTLRSTGVICVYVAVGKQKAQVKRLVEQLHDAGALAHTVVIVASADDAATLQFLAPFAGCAMGEYFRDQGHDVLVVYDDLSQHAWAYRTLSNQLGRPSGREAYPGDIFYLHARLLERAGRLSDKLIIIPVDCVEPSLDVSLDGHIYEGPLGLSEAKTALEQLSEGSAKIAKLSGSGGSLTALPIVETLQGDVTAYIPTNIISITDGQIYLEPDLFYGGIRPAINVGISVSRVGGDAQTRVMKRVGQTLRLEMAMYREMKAFSLIGEMDEATRRVVDHGRRLEGILSQQDQHPLSLGEEVVLLYAASRRYTDTVNTDEIAPWKDELMRFVRTGYGSLIKEIEYRQDLTTEIEEALVSLLTEYGNTHK